MNPNYGHVFQFIPPPPLTYECVYGSSVWAGAAGSRPKSPSSSSLHALPVFISIFSLTLCICGGGRAAAGQESGCDVLCPRLDVACDQLGPGPDPARHIAALKQRLWEWWCVVVVQIHCHRLRLNYTIHTLRLIQYTTAVILHTVQTKVLASPYSWAASSVGKYLA